MTGIIVLNKPKGISSNTAANIVKSITKSKKAGHLGTLDVEGEGVLPIVLDKATCLFEYYLQKDKVYKTVFEFGYTTDTLDLEGQVTARDENLQELSSQDIEKVIPSLVGKYNQMPPAYSAKKIKGKKAYQLARAGKEVSLRPKEVEIYSIKLLQKVEQNTFEFEIHCSSGTYIRSIARDMAEKLSTYGIMRCIQRTRCGEFDLKDSFTLDEIRNGNYKMTKLDDLFCYPSLNFTDTECERLLNGVNITKTCDDKVVQEGLYKAYHGNDFLGICQIEKGKTYFKYRFV